MNEYALLTLTHKNFDLRKLGKFVLDGFADATSPCHEILTAAKIELEIDEMMYTSTCNRVSFFLVTQQEIDPHFIGNFLKSVFPEQENDLLEDALDQFDFYTGSSAIQHLFEVAGSLDSMVVGEREIFKQLKNAYELNVAAGLCGDRIRIAIRSMNAVAKRIFGETRISEKPVSVVSLSIADLLGKGISCDSKVLLVGAGATISTAGKLLKKNGFHDFAIFNRSLENAEMLVSRIGGTADLLENISNYQNRFDILIACTAANEPIITTGLFESLNHGEERHKTLIDLGVPGDIDPNIADQFNVSLVDVEQLKNQANKNLAFRIGETEKAREIVEAGLLEFEHNYRQREVEKAMGKIPGLVKGIREKAVSEVFEKEIASLDQDSKKVLDDVLAYMEKKYISVPIKEAKKVMIEGNF